MSDHAVIFDQVTKCYAMTSLAGGGIKSFLLHLPQHIRDLSRPKSIRALDNLSLQVAPGECFGIIGRNGSGKSTLLGLIAGTIRPTAGTVTTRGHICPLLELGAGFHRDLSGRDNIVLNGVLLGMTRRQVMDQMDAIIAFSGLQASIDQPLRSFSTGMVARLGFSVAVHLDPEILLVDEVLAVGDQDFQLKCLQRIEQFRRAGKTILFVSHDLPTVEQTCDRVAVLDAGKLVEIGRPAEVVSRYRQTLHA